MAILSDRNEDLMPDLYAINMHLQERLEEDWRAGSTGPACCGD